MRLRLAVAEGDTGGVLLAQLTAVPGSSAVVIGGVVAYADSLKTGLLDVPTELIAQHGSVSAECASAMALGVARRCGAELGLATTGIAGPGGARPGKPVGLAYVAVCYGASSLVKRHEWSADRDTNRFKSAEAALQLALALLDPK